MSADSDQPAFPTEDPDAPSVNEQISDAASQEHGGFVGTVTRQGDQFAGGSGDGAGQYYEFDPDQARAERKRLDAAMQRANELKDRIRRA